jgi:hypothetical protein
MKEPFEDLYPGLSGEQYQEAHSNLDEYFDLAFEIVQQNRGRTEGVVDIPVPEPRMEERSNTTLKH